MIKYICDICNQEVSPSKIDIKPISTVEIIDPNTGKQDSKMFCQKCTVQLGEWIKNKQQEAGVISVGDDLNLKIKK